MDLADAMQIVLDLARQNLAPTEMLEERKRQEEALAMVEDFTVNELGDD